MGGKGLTSAGAIPYRSQCKPVRMSVVFPTAEIGAEATVTATAAAVNLPAAVVDPAGCRGRSCGLRGARLSRGGARDPQ
jgi:hypothetical protein